MSNNTCKGCCEDKMIVNKHFYLCLECNNKRLHGSKYGKQRNYEKNDREWLKTPKKIQIPKIKEKSKASLFTNLGEEGKNKINHIIIGGVRSGKTILLDEAFYEECFNNVVYHICEECGAKLPDEFKDSQGKIIARWRYSHIIAKSIAPELRWDIKNINHLCLEHHTNWDFGNKFNMKIYESNRKKFPQYLK
jgi:hypothetical protein